MSPERPDVGDRVAAAEAVVTNALRAFESQDWRRLVDLTDAGSLLTLMAHYVQQKRHQLEQRQEHESGMLASPDVPESFRDYINNRRDIAELAGITSLDEVAALTPDEFLTRWAQARHPEYLVNGEAPWQDDHTLEHRIVVGSIAVSPDTVAVMVRPLGNDGVSALAVYALIAVIGDNRGGWALDAAAAWLGLADWFL